MITVQSAIEHLKKESQNLHFDFLPLEKCLNLVAANDVFAPINVPFFDNSAMDGYAFRWDDFECSIPIKVVHEIQAGTSTLSPLSKGEAARIFTGAPIPENADTVVAQEDVSVENGLLKFHKIIHKNANIRKKGTQTQKGTLILKKNTVLSAEYLGFLATFGIKELEVYAKPRVGIMVTGKELAAIGSLLKTHQIYESNSVFLKVALQELGIEPKFCIWVDDDKEALKKQMNEHVKSVDVLILTGGISVGDYDFVKPVLEDLGVQEQFYKVKQKPGKPLYFCTLDSTSIFALPGNPSAVVMCYHVYIKSFLQSKMGIGEFSKKEYGILLNEYTKKPKLTHFVKAFVDNNKVEILTNQLSYQMDAYAKANAFAVLAEHQEHFQIGEKVEVIKFKN